MITSTTDYWKINVEIMERVHFNVKIRWTNDTKCVTIEEGWVLTGQLAILRIVCYHKEVAPAPFQITGQNVKDINRLYQITGCQGQYLHRIWKSCDFTRWKSSQNQFFDFNRY